MASEVDHVLPKHRGGTDDWANLEALCQLHHRQKTVAEAAAARWGR
jgi:5-methylcytosine-specific restriction protein A